MQKYFPVIIVFLFFLSCSASKRDGVDDKELLTVTIEPQRYFLNQIAGDIFRINTLVPPGTSPETYEPAPSVMLEMAKSKIYFKVGDLGFERAWSSRLSDNNPDVKVVDCSAGIELMGGHIHDHEDGDRSEERRVGKECRSRWRPYHWQYICFFRKISYRYCN